MIQKVLAYVEQHHMIEQGDHILAGVSGGADSVCLLLLLCRLRQQYDCKVTVVHVEHGIRGKDSLKDAEFVKELCHGLLVECRVFHCDAVAFSRERGMSLEEGARELRYQYFEETREAVGANKIAVAHNQNDCAETLLFHLARGTGLKGMCGIAPIRGSIIRPLLCVERKEIEDYLIRQGQSFCVDATNEETEYSRNKIRHQVLPVLREINAQAVAHLYRSTEYVTEAVELLEVLVQQARAECVVEAAEGVVEAAECVVEAAEGVVEAVEGVVEAAECVVEAAEGVVEEKRYAAGALGIDNGKREFFVKESLDTYPLLVQKTLIRKLLAECAGSERDISDTHVNQVKKLFAGQVGKYVMLPYRLEARRSYEGVLIHQVEERIGRQEEWIGRQEERSGRQEKGSRTKGNTEVQVPVPQPVTDGSVLTVWEHDWCMTARILEKSGDFLEIPKKTYTKWFDYDKIKGTLLLRTRCQGDFFVVDAQGRKQSLKKYFINEKVPAKERERIPVLADESHILWVVGYRISEAYKVTADTKRILEIQVNGGNIYE